MMNTDLNSAGQLPSSQPFHTAPWDYDGTETLPAPLSADVVDWVLVELRTGTAPEQALVSPLVFFTKTGLLM